MSTDDGYTVYGMRESGNCYKVGLVLEQLRIPYHWRETDILQGASRTEDFLAMNPNGRVPVLEIAPGDWLIESNAILWYLAENSALLPDSRRLRAEVLKWMFFEQYSHEPYIAVARFICHFLPEDHPRRVELPRLHKHGRAALDIMEQHLGEAEFLAGDSYSVADIALYAYTHCAEDAGLPLDDWPGIRAWLARVRGRPGYRGMDEIGRER